MMRRLVIFNQRFVYAASAARSSQQQLSLMVMMGTTAPKIRQLCDVFGIGNWQRSAMDQLGGPSCVPAIASRQAQALSPRGF
jgi:hypothetical protein